MPVKVLIPSPLRSLTAGAEEVPMDDANETVAGLLNRLDAQFPGLSKRICGDDGKLRRFVNVYVNNEDIRFLGGEATAVKSGDTISIIPAVAGG